MTSRRNEITGVKTMIVEKDTGDKKTSFYKGLKRKPTLMMRFLRFSYGRYVYK
jgi:hypothetical protein